MSTGSPASHSFRSRSHDALTPTRSLAEFFSALAGSLFVPLASLAESRRSDSHSLARRIFFRPCWEPVRRLGGLWERFIQSVKRCKKKSLVRTTFSYGELNTLLAEIESVVNSKPLTYVEDNQDGVSYTLSPLHLINGWGVTNTPNDSHFEVVSTNESLTQRARHHHHLLRQFTDQWKKTQLNSQRNAMFLTT